MKTTELLDIAASNVLHKLRGEATSLLGVNALGSPRAVGDAVQMYLAGEHGLKTCLPGIVAGKFESGFSRRSMEDMAFYYGNLYFAVDCKTHNIDTEFNMPNLISVQRLANFYRNDTNTFCILIVEYSVNDSQISYRQCHFKPIEALEWNCLTFGALGWGQIQIANANRLKFSKTPDRRAWMLELCNRIDRFYCDEIGKIGERRRWFDDVREYWESHTAAEVSGTTQH